MGGEARLCMHDGEEEKSNLRCYFLAVNLDTGDSITHSATCFLLWYLGALPTLCVELT